MKQKRNYTREESPDPCPLQKTRILRFLSLLHIKRNDGVNTLCSLLVLFESVVYLLFLLFCLDRVKTLRIRIAKHPLSYRVLHILGKTLVLLQCFMNGFFMLFGIPFSWLGHSS